MLGMLFLCLFACSSLDAGNVSSVNNPPDVPKVIEKMTDAAFDGMAQGGIGELLRDINSWGNPVEEKSGGHTNNNDGESYHPKGYHTDNIDGENHLHLVARGTSYQHTFMTESTLRSVFEQGGLSASGGHKEYFTSDVHKRNRGGRTPLHVAAECGKSMQTGVFLDFGATINEGDNDGNTPLHLACKNKHTVVIRILIERGADPTLTNNAGQLPS